MAWWRRAGASGYATVPKNVARQWIWQHWGLSPYRELPSVGAQFALRTWRQADIESAMSRRDADEYRSWGETLLENYRVCPPEVRPTLPGTMDRRGIWPVPVIVMHNDGRFDFPALREAPHGPILIDGNRRFAVALALAAQGRLAAELLVWELHYQ